MVAVVKRIQFHTGYWTGDMSSLYHAGGRPLYSIAQNMAVSCPQSKMIQKREQP